MRTAIILGRGVEGCGVTRCAVEFQKATTGTKIFATIDKKWPRRKSMVFENTDFKCANWEEVQPIVDEINRDFDNVLVYSVPPKNMTDECRDNFVKMLKSIKLKRGLVQLDHSIHSIVRNGNFKEVCEELDVLMTHSLTSDFCRWLKKNEIETPVKKMALGFNYADHRKKYWKPIEEQDPRLVRWIGRTTGWKGPGLMIDFHNEMLMKEDYITVLEGLEASISWGSIVWKDKEQTVARPCINKFRPRKELGETRFAKDGSDYGTEQHGQPAYLYPPYTNHDCMERMSLGAFGSDLYHLKPQKYGNNIENCHAECIAVGNVPIFHKHFGDHVVHRVTGNPVSQDKHSGTIFLDYTNFEECRDLMVKLSNDMIMREEWRNMSYDYWVQHSDASICVQEILDNLTS